jgi:hypothetical protein
MVSDLEKLSSGLRKGTDQQPDDAQRLVAKIKSDPQIQNDLKRTGEAQVKDDDGRTFVVRRKVPAAGTSAETAQQTL